MKKSSLKPVSSMFDKVLSRHGIGKQVEAANIVRQAQDILVTMLGAHAAGDVVALSFKDGVLTLAGRHSVAVYDAEGVAHGLGRKLEEHFPHATFTVVARLRPDAFTERGML